MEQLGIEMAGNVKLDDALEVGGDVEIKGALTVDGLTTTIHTGNVIVQDKTLELGDGKSDLNGGGIKLGTAQDEHSILYNSGAWKLSENLDIADNKSYSIGGTDVLSKNELHTVTDALKLAVVGTLHRRRNGEVTQKLY